MMRRFLGKCCSMATITVGPDPVLAAACVMTPPVVVDGPAQRPAFSHRFSRFSTTDVPKRFGQRLGGSCVLIQRSAWNRNSPKFTLRRYLSGGAPYQLSLPGSC